MNDTQGVLLRYRGGEVYALPTAEPHVWRVAGVEVHVGIVATHPVHNTVIGLETFDSLASAAAFRRFATDATFRAGEVDAAIAAAEAVLAKYERPQPKRAATKAKAKRTGKSKRRVAAKGGR